MKRKLLFLSSTLFLLFFVNQFILLNNETESLNFSKSISAEISQKQCIDSERFDPEIGFPATCFAPGTDPNVIEEFYANKNNLMNSLGVSNPNAKFNLNNRWSSTALDGAGLAQGDFTTLTWSYAPDGTPIGNGGCGVSGESTDPSNFIAFFNGIYGPPTTPGDFTTAPWHQIFIDMFNSWSEVSGLTFVYEPNDDGATVVSGGAGTSGTRGDLRISGHPLDGNSGVLACNYFPQNGDMIIDTSDNFFVNNSGLGTTNVLTHEIGHGLGILHVCPVEETKLMEPFVSLAFQGPQEDDILATNRSYGDPEGDNNTPANATFLGSNPNPETYTIQQRSIDDNSELDYYSFMVSETSTLIATLTPTGTTYLDGVQLATGACSGGTNFNALTVSDLMLEVLDTDGNSILGTADSNNAGVAENLIVVIPSSGTYFVRIQQQQETPVDNVQMYNLELSLQTNSCTISTIPTNIQASSISSTSATIAWDSQSSTLYDLRYRESGTTPWIDITDLATASATLTGLTQSTEYEVEVRSKCPGDTASSYSSSILFLTLEALIYCDAGGNGASDSAGFEKISNVSFNTIDNNSTSTAGYENFTSVYTSLSRGLTYSFEASFTGQTFPTDEVLVWMDFNKDGDFEDLGEEVLATPQGVSPWFGNITIPVNASLGETRMRIRLHDSDAAFGGNPTPCGDSGYGQVEDYTVVIYDNFVHYDNIWTPQNPMGISTISDDILVVNGNPVLTSLTDANTLTIQRGGSLNVEGVLHLSGNLENDGNLIFKSDDTGSGQFDEFTGTITGLGEITVERHIPAKRAFRLLASPVTTTDFIYENWQENGSTPAIPNGLGTHITGGDAPLGFDQSGSGNPSMFTFDNDNSNGGVQTDDWYALPNTNNTKLEVGEPYLTFVRGDRSINLTNSDSPATSTILRAKGSLYTGPFSPVLSSTPDFYNLVANPYQAVVDYNAVTKTGLTDFIYVWDASIDGANGRGGYVTVELPAGSATEGEPPSPSSSDADQYLAPGMSFFVQNDSDGATTTSITFEEADKATAENQVTVFSTYTNFYINSRLYRSSNLQNGDTESDAIGLRFSDDFTTLGNSEDATKLFNPGENYAIVNNGLRSIDKQEIPTIGHIVDLSILNYQDTNYSLTFEMENKPTGLGVFLEDSYLNTITELSDSFVYDYTVDANIPASIASDRFSLVFDNTTLGVDENTFGENFSLYPNPANNGQFAIKTPNLSGEVIVEMMNTLGQQVYKETLAVEGNEVNVNAIGLSTGIYIVELSQDENKFTSKLIIR